MKLLSCMVRFHAAAKAEENRVCRYAERALGTDFGFCLTVRGRRVLYSKSNIASG
jgi:hypothetical protein